MKAVKIIFGVLLLLTVQTLIKAQKKKEEFNLNFQQNDYHVKFERAQLNRYNKDFMRNISVITYKYNRTMAVVNFTAIFDVDVGNDLVTIIQLYKFMSNEYRYFPLRLAANWCKAFAANVGGMHEFVSCGTFNGCPIVKGKKYDICKFQPDPAKLPPLIPNGDYKVEMQNCYLSTELYVIDAYLSITRPIPIP